MEFSKYLAGWISKKGNKFHWNDQGLTPYTDESAEPLENNEWGDNKHIILGMDGNMISKARTHLAEMIDTRKITADGQTKKISPGEKREIINYYGGLIEGYYNHPNNRFVNARKKRAAEVTKKEFTDTTALVNIQYRNKINSGVNSLRKAVQNAGKGQGKIATDNWKKTNMEEGNLNEADINAVMKAWAESIDRGKRNE